MVDLHILDARSINLAKDPYYVRGIPSFALLGQHFSSKDDVKFDHIQGRFSYLTNWAHSLFPSEWNEAAPDRSEPADHIELELSGSTLSIFPVRHRSTGHQRSTSFSNLHISIQASWTSTVPMSIPEWDTIQISWFEELLTFCTGRTNVLEHLSARSSLDPRSPLVELLFKPKSPPDAEQPFLGPMLLSFEQMQSNIGTIMARWLELREEIPSVQQLYFADRYHGRNLPSSTARFLFLAQALETYHRIRWDEPIEPKAEWRKKISRIVSNLSHEDAVWTKQELAWSNSQKLLARLQEIVARTSPVSDEIIKDVEPFLKQYRDTRNYYTHYDSRLKSKVFTGPKLEGAIAVSIVLLETLILLELGFTSIEALAMLRDMPQYDQVMWFRY